eukprot:4758925-Pyramimonas_sp.AAC.1
MYAQNQQNPDMTQVGSAQLPVGSALEAQVFGSQGMIGQTDRGAMNNFGQMAQQAAAMRGAVQAEINAGVRVRICVSIKLLVVTCLSETPACGVCPVTVQHPLSSQADTQTPSHAAIRYGEHV